MTPDEMVVARINTLTRRNRKQRQMLERRGIPINVPAADVANAANGLIRLGWSMPALIAMNGDGSVRGLSLILRGESERCHRKWLPLSRMVPTYAVPDSVPDECLVPVQGAQRRVRALMALGWRHDDMTPLMGTATWRIARSTYDSMDAGTWRRIDAAYQRLSGHVGPSERTRARAVKLGYLPPLAYDDIDQPKKPARFKHRDSTADEVTVLRILGGEWRVPSTRADRTEVVRRYTGSLNELARLTGWGVWRYIDKEAS